MKTQLDLLPLLPRELSLSVLETLSQSQIAHASSINQKWRRLIHSNPILFTKVDLISRNALDDELSREDSKLEMGKAIERILRFSRLSNLRLTDVSLNLIPFMEDLRLVGIQAQSSRYSILCHTLTLSAHSLKRLYLQLAKIDYSKKKTSDVSVQINSILQSLKTFHQLETIEISASTLCNVISKSSSETLKITSNDSYYDPYSAAKIEVKVDKILKSMRKFTGVGMTHLELKGVADSRSDRLLLELRKSRKTLESLDLSDIRRLDKRVWFALIVACPNLGILKMYLVSTLRDWQLDVSVETCTSRLKVAKLGKFELQAGQWEHLGIWLGEELEELGLWLSGFRGDGLHLCKLFKPFSSSIKTLSLRASVSSSLGPSAILSFPSLQVLTLIGTIWSGHFIFQHQYSSLQRLDIRVAKCKAELHLNHKDILRILESCRNSLVSVEMIEWCDEMYGDAADQITESEKSEVLASVPETFSLPQLENLDLCFISSTYQRLYSSLDCPSLNPRTSFFDADSF